jgi:hypothetical protein
MLTTLALTVALSGPPQLIDPPDHGPIARHIEQTVFSQDPMRAETRFRQAGSRDSLKNGAVIGAVVGGIATGLLMGYVCHLVSDTDTNCWPAALVYAAGGAGAGALVGAGVDALFQRRVGVRVPIKF